ncbi:hypothetical protein D9M68_715930 [compost metagenome]
MKKLNLLSRAEMRKVMGGTEPVGGFPGPDGGGEDDDLFGCGMLCRYPDGVSACNKKATATNSYCPPHTPQGVLEPCPC